MEVDNLDKLTPREKQAALLATEGLSNAEISAKMGLKYKTVKDMFTNIYPKLDVSSRNKMIVKIFKMNLPKGD